MSFLQFMFSHYESCTPHTSWGRSKASWSLGLLPYPRKIATVLQNIAFGTRQFSLCLAASNCRGFPCYCSWDKCDIFLLGLEVTALQSRETLEKIVVLPLKKKSALAGFEFDWGPYAPLLTVYSNYCPGRYLPLELIAEFVWFFTCLFRFPVMVASTLDMTLFPLPFTA